MTGVQTCALPISQAVAKLERGHTRDVADVDAMLDRGLVTRAALLAFLDAIEGELYRFPAVDPGTLRRAVETAAGRPPMSAGL